MTSVIQESERPKRSPNFRWILITAAMLLPLVATTVLVPLSFNLAEQAVASETAIKAAIPPTTQTTSLRALPLRIPGGLLETMISSTAKPGVTDPGMLTKAAANAGISQKSMAAVRQASARVVEALPELEKAQDGPDYIYPYVYPDVDALTTAMIAQSNHQDSPLLELANMFLWTGDAVTAFSLLERMREAGDTCDIQLSLAFTVSLGTFADTANIVNEYRRAESLCDRDITPGFMRASSSLVGAFAWESSSAQSLAASLAAISDYQLLQREFPNDPAAYVGEAAVLVLLAKTSDRLSMSGQQNPFRPFTSRAQARRALELTEGLQVSAMGGVVKAIRAQAFDLLGQDREVVDSLPDSLQWPTEYLQIRQRALIHLRLYASAADMTPIVAKSGVRCAAMSRAYIGDPWSCVRAFPDAAGKAAGGSGGLVTSFGDFIPTTRFHRPDWYPFYTPAEVAILAGRFEDPSIATDSTYEALSRIGKATSAGDVPGSSNASGRSELLSSLDLYQDLLRSAGDYPEAERRLNLWLADSNLANSALLHDRLGEVYFLQHLYPEAVSEFKIAEARQTEAGVVDEDPYDLGTTSIVWDDIKVGAALARSGKKSDAEQILQSVTAKTPAQIEARAAELGTVLVELQEYPRGIELLIAARDAAREELRPPTGTYDNNLSLAYTKSGETQAAVTAALTATQVDPANPVFLENLAIAEQLNGDVAQAAKGYQDAIQADSTLFSSHNNLGVLLSRSGDWVGGAHSFAAAIRVRPEYAIAWWNLGVALTHLPGPVYAIAAQGAFGRAGQLDQDFVHQSPGLVIDSEIYDAGLDLARAIPPDLRVGVGARQTSSPMVWFLFAIFAIRIGFDLSRDALSGRLNEKLLLKLGHMKWGLAPAGVAVLTAAAATLWAFKGILGTSPIAFGIVVGVVVCTMTAVIGMRHSLASGDVKHTSSTTANLLAIIGSAIGLPFLTAPALIAGEEQSSMVRWSGPLLLMGASLTFNGLALVSRVPMASVLAQALTLGFASTLLPVRPFEGATITKRWLGLTAATLLAALGLLVTLQLV